MLELVIEIYNNMDVLYGFLLVVRECEWYEKIFFDDGRLMIEGVVRVVVVFFFFSEWVIVLCLIIEL